MRSSNSMERSALAISCASFSSGVPPRGLGIARLQQGIYSSFHRPAIRPAFIVDVIYPTFVLEAGVLRPQKFGQRSELVVCELFVRGKLVGPFDAIRQCYKVSFCHSSPIFLLFWACSSGEAQRQFALQ